MFVVGRSRPRGTQRNGARLHTCCMDTWTWTRCVARQNGVGTATGQVGTVLAVDGGHVAADAHRLHMLHMLHGHVALLTWTMMDMECHGHVATLARCRHDGTWSVMDTLGAARQVATAATGPPSAHRHGAQAPWALAWTWTWDLHMGTLVANTDMDMDTDSGTLPRCRHDRHVAEMMDTLLTMRGGQRRTSTCCSHMGHVAPVDRSHTCCMDMDTLRCRHHRRHGHMDTLRLPANSGPTRLRDGTDRCRVTWSPRRSQCLCHWLCGADMDRLHMLHGHGHVALPANTVARTVDTCHSVTPHGRCQWPAVVWSTYR